MKSTGPCPAELSDATRGLQRPGRTARLFFRPKCDGGHRLLFHPALPWLQRANLWRERTNLRAGAAAPPDPIFLKKRVPPGFFRVQEGSATDLVKFKSLIRRRFN